jgi:hypothetical protein
MKRIFTLIVITLFTLNLSAQKIEKGIWQIEIGTGIDANYNWITDGDWETKTTFNGNLVPGSDNDGDWSDIYDSQTNLNYDLDFTNFSDWESRFLDGISFGYFISDGFLIGLGLDLSGLHTSDNYNNDPFEGDIVKWNEFKLGAIPKIRYYIETGRNKAMFFEGSFGMGVNNRNAFVEGSLIPAGSDPWDYDIIAYDPVSGSGISAQADENDTWESKRNIFSTSIGIGIGYSGFVFSSREIFSIEPQIGFSINSRNRVSETITYDESQDDTNVFTQEDNISNMGVYAKLKLGFYLGRHFWSH